MARQTASHGGAGAVTVLWVQVRKAISGILRPEASARLNDRNNVAPRCQDGFSLREAHRTFSSYRNYFFLLKKTQTPLDPDIVGRWGGNPGAAQPSGAVRGPWGPWGQ